MFFHTSLLLKLQQCIWPAILSIQTRSLLLRPLSVQTNLDFNSEFIEFVETLQHKPWFGERGVEGYLTDTWVERCGWAAQPPTLFKSIL